jgi:hypothetical protein
MEPSLDELLKTHRRLSRANDIDEATCTTACAAIEAVLSESHDVSKCTKCGVLERINLLDGKRPEGVIDENADFTELQCVSCYGPGWCPTGGDDDIAQSVHAPYALLYVQWQRDEEKRTAARDRDESNRVIQKLLDALAAVKAHDFPWAPAEEGGLGLPYVSEHMTTEATANRRATRNSTIDDAFAAGEMHLKNHSINSEPPKQEQQ